MEQTFSEAFYLTGAVLLGIGLVALGSLLLMTVTDTRTYYQIRGIKHNKKWTYTIDKMIKWGKPDDEIDDEEKYFTIWFRNKDQAEAYLLTLRQQIHNTN